MDPALPPRSLPGFERSLAIVIGINSYSHGVPPLLNAVRDASAVADTLEHQGFEVLRVLDSQASLQALSNLLSNHLPSLQPRLDRLLLYFAGHGLARTDDQHHLSGFLLPADARRDEPSTYWPMDSLRQALVHLSCRHLLVILDCCFAGAFPHASFRDLRAPAPHAPLFLERFRHFSSRRSFQLLLSTSHDELASDRLLAKPSQEALGSGLHSPFARALLEALQPSSPADSNQDGLLTASELYTFLRDRMLILLPSHSQQTPSLRHLDWHEGGEFLFLLSDSFPSLPLASPLSKHSNPYLGLRPFSSEHRHLFFGRERLIDDLLERLRSQPLLVLCSPSGAGKSSLVHAGLIPRLQEDASWQVPPTLRPSPHPLQQISTWLASLSPESPPPSSSFLEEDPHLAAGFLQDYLSRHPRRSVLLVIDPLEELVTTCRDDSVRRSFLRALASLLQFSQPRFRLLLLLRSDFEPHFLSILSPSFLSLELWRETRFLLPPMNREELRRCIQKPAEASVLFFAPGLIERLLDDVEQMPGALPLLSVALSELFDAYIDSGRQDRTFSFEDYERLGSGIAGALRRRAELVFSGTLSPSAEGQPALPALPPEQLPAFQHTLRNVLLRMISAEGGELAHRRVPRAELEFPQPEENARVQRALAVLEAGRLVVASNDSGPCVEPAHDALLYAWPRLHNWARNSQHELLLLRRVSQAATEWLRYGQPDTLLWAGARLDPLGFSSTFLRATHSPLTLLASSPGGQPAEPVAFNRAECQFLRASAARHHRLRTRRYALTLAIAVSLVTLTIAALFQNAEAQRSASEAQQQKDAAIRQKVLALVNARLVQARRLHGEDPTKALLILRDVDPPNDESRKTWLQIALDMRRLALSRAILVVPQADITTAVFSPDGSRVLTTSWDGSARIWPSHGQGKPLVFKGNTASSIAASFSPDGSRVIITFMDGSAHIWPSGGQGEPVVLKGHTKGLSAATFSPDGSHVLTASIDGTVYLWPSDGHSGPRILKGHSDKLSAATFSPDGSRVLTASWDGSARIWPSDGQGEPLILKGHTKGLSAATFSPDGSRVLTASIDGTARIWPSNGQGSPYILEEQNGILSAAFSPDGSRILTVSMDGAARIWPSDGRGAPIVFNASSKGLTSAVFSPDGAHVLTASVDGTAHIWPSDGTDDPIVLRGHSLVLTSAVFSPNGSRALTVSMDGTARIWSSNGDSGPSSVKKHSDKVLSIAFTPDGSRVLIASADGTARTWHSDGFGEAFDLKVDRGQLTSATFSPDGSRILTASADGTARIWPLSGHGAPLILQGNKGRLTSAAFSADGLHILTASIDGTARIWRLDGHTEPIVLKGHTAELTVAALSPDGSRVLTASADGTARIWPLGGHSKPLILNGNGGQITAAAFTSDGSRVVIGTQAGTTIIWPLNSDGTPLVLEERSLPITSVAFSPDGAHVLAASIDGTARIWPSDGLGEPFIIRKQRQAASANCVAFSPDSARIAIGYSDGSFHIVPIEPHLVRDSLRTATTACLTARERERYLLESPGEAREGHARCERTYDRLP